MVRQVTHSETRIITPPYFSSTQNPPCTENLQQKVQKAHPKKESSGRHNFAEPAHLLYRNNRYIQEPDRIDCPLLRTPFFRHCVTPTYYMLQDKKKKRIYKRDVSKEKLKERPKWFYMAVKCTYIDFPLRN